MDKITQKCCPNCSQSYVLQIPPSSENNLPLLLACKHSMCENCIINILGFAEPIQCKVCLRDMIVEASQLSQLDKDQGKLRQLFPVDIRLVVELAMQYSQDASFLDVLRVVTPNFDETETECDIDHLLHNIVNETGTGSELNQIIAIMEQHCSEHYSRKQDLLDNVAKNKNAEKTSLLKVKDELAVSIKKAAKVMDSIKKITSHPEKINVMDLAQLLEDAKQVVASPWRLTVTTNPPQVNEHIGFEGNMNTTYKLSSTEDLGEDVEIPPPPPPAPVLPEDDCNRPHSAQPVQPFPESQQPKQLQEGSQEFVFVSHIVNPHNFYVQRSCHQKLVMEMLQQFRTAVSLPKPSVNHVTEGKTYLALNTANNKWQRCCVVSIDRTDPAQPLFQVFCFDFGSTQTVNIEKLRLLPPAIGQPPVPLAIHCSLANCVPKTGAWSSNDSILMYQIIDNKPAVIHVRRMRPTSDYGATVECDVTTVEDGVSLSQALVFHERAKMINPKLKYPLTSCIRQKAKVNINNDDYKHKTVEEVYISHVESPDKFYVRKKYQQADYEQLSLELAQEYSLSVNTGTIYLPEIGMSCCVHVPEAAGGGAWERALVLSTPGRARAALLLLDSGAPLLAHWASLRYLHPKFAKLSALATECHLAGLTPLNKKWSPGSVALLQQYGDRVLELRVEGGRRRGSVGVRLFHRAPDSEEVVCVNQEMISQKFAITFGIHSFNKCDDTADQVITNKSPLDEPVRHPKPKPEVQILKRNTPNEPQKIKAVGLEAKDKGPLKLEAKVLRYLSPSLIYISLVHQQKTYNEVFENMQKHYSKNIPTKKTNWQVGDRCCTVCIQSQTWRRAIIVEIEGDNAKLFYSDFACVETLPLANLAELTPDFASIGDAAIKCHLYGVIPSVGEEWPSLTKEYLKELLDSYQRVFITKLGNFTNKSMPIEIWVYHTIPGSALEPNKSEWRCLNKKIIEQGLGVPDKSVETADTETKPEAGDEMLSFLNVTGSIIDWLQLEAMPTKPLPKFFPESPTTSTTSIENEDVTEGLELESSNVIFISDWLPPEPFTSNEFTGVPTYIDNDAVIYIHATSQRGTLDLIRKALDVRFRDPDPKVKHQKWVVGEPCVSLFYLDNRFYRGRVLEVNNETSTCLIHYIDYGNEEQCSFENLRKSIALHQIPTQAHNCVLNRIGPNGNHWKRHTLDYMHKTIVEKECYIKVAGGSVDGITPIELKYDKLSINDHLVEFELAAYTDGSKAVVRRFAPTHWEEKVRLPAPASDDDPDYIVVSDGQGSHEASSMVTARDE